MASKPPLGTCPRSYAEVWRMEMRKGRKPRPFCVPLGAAASAGGPAVRLSTLLKPGSRPPTAPSLTAREKFRLDYLKEKLSKALDFNNRSGVVSRARAREVSERVGCPHSAGGL
jgi:hypothetical protein